MTVQEILLPDGSDFSVAEEPGETQGAKMILDHPGVMARAAKKIFPPPRAAKQAAAVNFGAAQVPAGRLQQIIHVLGGGSGITPLKLYGLAGARQRAHGQHPRIGVAANQISHQEITAMKILQVFIDDETDE